MKNSHSPLFLAVIALLLSASGLAQAPDILTLSGKVVMEDGSAPPHEVKVEFLCNARVIQVARTRHEGSFHFRLGEARRPTELSASSAGPDTLEVGGRGIGGLRAGGGLRESGDGRYDLTNCEIRVTPRPDWRANKITLGVESIFEPDVGVITIHQVQPTAGTLVSASTLSAPKDAVKALNKAKKELGRKNPRYERAAGHAQQAVEIYPGFAEAWKFLGDTQLGMDERDAAYQAYRKAIEADANFVPPYLTLAEMELEQYRYQQALEYTDKLVELTPNDSKAHYYNGLARYSTGGLEEAMESFAVIEKNGAIEQYPGSLLMMGDAMARQGQVAGAAKYLRRYLEVGQPSPEMEEKIRRQLQVWAEQGLIEEAG
ncbi:MAG TPA: tetratricopeptide repeat protein [Acidobacteriota bacterium]|nr:tetratricopeptide repeat protein [Acidobacteriota bacterium]